MRYFQGVIDLQCQKLLFRHEECYHVFQLHLHYNVDTAVREREKKKWWHSHANQTFKRYLHPLRKDFKGSIIHTVLNSKG